MRCARSRGSDSNDAALSPLISGSRVGDVTSARASCAASPVQVSDEQRTLRPCGALLSLSLGAASFHKSMGAASLHKSVGAASLHTSMGAASLHKSVGAASLHKSMGAASLHTSMGAASLHKSMGAASLHKSMGATSLHKSMGPAPPRAAFQQTKCLRRMHRTLNTQPV